MHNHIHKMIPIRTLIVEDEPLAAKRLQKLLVEISPKIELLDVIDTVEDAVAWFKSNQMPDLVMLDIQLADGVSFDIFKEISLQSFVIFTTAYDQYALRAFELNSIDYLLKPIDKEKLASALHKFEMLRGISQPIDISGLLKSLSATQPTYKRRFVANIGDKLKSIDTADIAYFYSLEKNTFLCTQTGEQYAIDFSLDKLEGLLDPEHFFRINRQYFVKFEAIGKMSVLSSSRIKIDLHPKTDETVMVSSARTHAFRNWLDR
jgi:DNA-binding LytR/AlgR family response regulator